MHHTCHALRALTTATIAPPSLLCDLQSATISPCTLTDCSQHVEHEGCVCRACANCHRRAPFTSSLCLLQSVTNIMGEVQRLEAKRDNARHLIQSDTAELAAVRRQVRASRNFERVNIFLRF